MIQKPPSQSPTKPRHQSDHWHQIIGREPDSGSNPKAKTTTVTGNPETERNIYILIHSTERRRPFAAGSRCCLVSCCGVIPRLIPRQTSSRQKKKMQKALTRDREKKGSISPSKRLTLPYILGCRKSEKRSERLHCVIIRQNRKPDISRTKKTPKNSRGRTQKSIKTEKRTAFPPPRVTQYSTRIFPKQPRRETQTPTQEKMQDLNGPTARKKWNLPLKVALQKKNRNPPMNPGADEMAGVFWGGRQPIAGTNHCHRDRGHLDLEGSQWRPPPPPVVNQAAPRTTPSRRRVTRYGLVHNGWGVGRHCGRSTGIAISYARGDARTQEQAKNQKKRPHRKPETTQRNKQNHPNPEKKNSQ